MWDQSAGILTNIMANRYTAGTSSWGTAASVASFTQGSGGSAQIAMNGSGNAMVVWEQYDGTFLNIAGISYAAATSSWGTERQLRLDVGSTSGKPQVAIDAAGNALAVWIQIDAGTQTIWASRYTAGTSNIWGTAAKIQANNTDSASAPWIAMDPNGNAIAAWMQNDGTLQNIWAAAYTAGTGWGTAALIETNSAGRAYYPRLAFDANGKGLAVWEQDDGSTSSSIWTNRYQ